jgi:hypothetical protein
MRLVDIGFVLVGLRKAPWTWTFESWRGVPDFLGREDRCKGMMFLCVFFNGARIRRQDES